jgi:hypothetical protein
MKINTTILILEANRQPFLSVGTFAGGIKIEGIEYVFLSKHNAFIRKQYLKKYNDLTKIGTTWDRFIELVETREIDLIKIEPIKKEVKESVSDNQTSLF